MRVPFPTSGSDVRLVWRTSTTVLGRPLHAAFAALTAALSLTVFVVAQNVPLFMDLIVNGPLPLVTRLEILFNLYPFVSNAFDPVSEVLMVVAAALIGLNLSMLVYHVRNERLTLRGGTGSASGVVLGTMGAGCAACGSAVLAGTLSLFGATGVLALLPMDGAEFTALALLILVASIYWLADGMRGSVGEACPIEYGR